MSNIYLLSRIKNLVLTRDVGTSSSAICIASISIALAQFSQRILCFCLDLFWLGLAMRCCKFGFPTTCLCAPNELWTFAGARDGKLQNRPMRFSVIFDLRAWGLGLKRQREGRLLSLCILHGNKLVSHFPLLTIYANEAFVLTMR